MKAPPLLVDPRGREISSAPDTDESAAEAKKDLPKTKIIGLAVLAQCSDGAYRLIKMDEQLANSTLNFLKSRLGGKVTVAPNPLVVQEIVQVPRRPISRTRKILNFLCG